MSEAALTPSTLQRGRLASARGRRNRLNALEALERGFALFKSTVALEAWRYYSGAAPLVLCSYRCGWSTGRFGYPMARCWGRRRCSLAPIWCAHGACRTTCSAFGARVRRAETSARGRARTTGSHGTLACVENRPERCYLVALTTFAGAPWCYSACQFASLEAREDGSKRQTIGGCLALASQWFGGGLLLFLMLFPLWIAVWLNGLIVALLVPQLLHSILGVNTLLSTPMGMFALVRSSAFWLSLFAGAWLALDPIVKCSFVVVYQHLQSRHEGDDLRGLLASLPREQQKKAQMIASTAPGGRVAIGALVVLAAILAGTSPMASARVTQASLTRSSTETPADTAREAKIQKLRRALDEESRRAIYRWHDAEHPSQPTWFDKLLDKIGHRIERAWDAVQDFFRKLWPRGLNLSPGKESRARGSRKTFDYG